MGIALADGSEAAPSDPEELLARKEAWAAIDVVIAQARNKHGEQWQEFLSEQRKRLIVSLLPAGHQVWRVFMGQVVPDHRREGGQILLRMLGESALQVLVQFRCDMLEGSSEEIAAQVLAARDAPTAPPDGTPEPTAPASQG